MPTITVDGQTLSIDGHRLWIVSGTVAYHRMPSGCWSSRLASARLAGLNCIETPVPWALHEPRPGKFRFDGDLDLPAFVRLVARHRMHCILRVGPCIGDGMDLGGLPAWMLDSAGRTLRRGSPEFLQPVSKFFGEVCGRVRDLQVSVGRKSGGPIIAVQNEHQWTCGSVEHAHAYLAETNRFLRESGITVPILSCNDLFASAEGEIETWSGGQHLHAHMRQVRVLKSQHPRIVSALPTAARAAWGEEPATPIGPRALMRRLGEVLAAGAQYNLAPFQGGTNFGFDGGRVAGEADFACASTHPAAPVDEAGRPGASYAAVRRISTFASSFARVFAALDPAYQPAIVSLDPHAPLPGSRGTRPPSNDGGITAVECKGGRGSIVFLFVPELHEPGRRRCSLLLADGSTLPIEFDRDAVAWVLLDTHLVDRATLDYCSLNAFTAVGSLFVCYGPAGAPGVLSINGSAFEVLVPSGREPHLSTHEGVTVMVCNESSIDAVAIGEREVYVGAAGFDASGQPVLHPSFKKITRIGASGETRAATHAAPRRPVKIALGPWAAASCDEFVRGCTDRFASIDGPAPLEALGAPAGYGWMRLRLKNIRKTVKAGFFEAADRLHLFLDGEPAGLVGVGPGASGPITPLALRGAEHTLSILIDNLGRWSEGNAMGEPKGLFGPVWETRGVRAGSPKLIAHRPIEPLAWRAPIFGLDQGDVTDARRITWKLQHRRRTPLALRLGGLADPALLIVNGEIFRVLERRTTESILLTPERWPRGIQEVQVAVVGDPESGMSALRECAEFFECVSNVSAKAAWAFAKWEPPASSKFKPTGSKGAAEFKGRPAWWRASISAEEVDRPLYLHAAGLSKGQIFVNGRNVCRYFVATRSGKSVPPQSRYCIPESWLHRGVNELMLFDEHGFAPDKVRVHAIDD
jgi:beta-galactosidase